MPAGTPSPICVLRRIISPLRRTTRRRRNIFESAPRDVRRARIRLAIEAYRGQMGSGGEPRDAEGNRITESPDGELSPLALEELLLPQQTSPVSYPKWYTVPNPAAPKHDAKAPPPTQPDWKASRVDASSYPRGDMEFPRRFLMTPAASRLITVAAEQLKEAGDKPV